MNKFLYTDKQVILGDLFVTNYKTTPLITTGIQISLDHYRCLKKYCANVQDDWQLET